MSLNKRAGDDDGEANGAKMPKTAESESVNHGGRPGPSWLPPGCSVVVADVYSPKNKTAKFAFPADLVYENLASLLGLILNPWTTGHSKEEVPAAVAAQSGEEGKMANSLCVTSDSGILRDMCVTPDMCQGYVEFRRFGRTSEDAKSFLVRAAAPTDLVGQYQYQVDRDTLVCAISYFVGKLGDKNYSRQKDVVQMFAAWTSGQDSIEIRVNDGKDYAHVILYQETAAIDALRRRICDKICQLPSVTSTLAHSSGMKSTIVEIMRNQTVPFYRVPLLNKEESVLLENTLMNL